MAGIVMMFWAVLVISSTQNEGTRPARFRRK